MFWKALGVIIGMLGDTNNTNNDTQRLSNTFVLCVLFVFRKCSFAFVNQDW